MPTALPVAPDDVSITLKERNKSSIIVV